jgi:uncharacterized protein (UPF0297 family)
VKHPLQHTKEDKDGTLRFVQNEVLKLILKVKKIDANEIADIVNAAPSAVTVEDMEQFYQLVGYSVSGAPIRDELKEAARKHHANGTPAAETRAELAEARLKSVRDQLRDGIAELFGIHPSALDE